jgi:protein gp37
VSASSIEWTDEVWNPVTGCDRVSPGCAHCYALELAPRLRAMQRARGTDSGWVDAPDGTRASSGPAFGVQLLPERLEQPLRWRKPRRVFVNSMSDLFHDDIPDEYIGRVFAVMAAAPQHTFQILTKRPERMHEVLHGSWRGWSTDFFRGFGSRPFQARWPLPNVWLGVSIENRRYVHRADILRATPAAVRFISAEPLLGPLIARAEVVRPGTVRLDGPSLDLTGIDWLIVGGESGPRHRPAKPDWVRDLRTAAFVAETAFFLKQWGGRTTKAGGRELDGRTWDEMPAVSS